MTGAALVLSATLAAAQTGTNPVVGLWAEGKPAFGVFVPIENQKMVPRSEVPRERPRALYTREGGQKLAANPLYDFVFLNLEAQYDAAAVKAIADGLRSGRGPRKALIVRIPTIEAERCGASLSSVSRMPASTYANRKTRPQ